MMCNNKKDCITNKKYPTVHRYSRNNKDFMLGWMLCRAKAMAVLADSVNCCASALQLVSHKGRLPEKKSQLLWPAAAGSLQALLFYRHEYQV